MPDTSPADLQHDAARAFAAPFAATPCLRDTWNQALVEGDGTYPDTRRRFWTHVNSRDTEASRSVAALVESAGYQLASGSGAPTLSEEFMPDWATPGRTHVIQDRLVTSPLNARTLAAADRLLTIDHMAAQSRNGELKVDASNLRFATGRDNSIRGNLWPATDELPLHAWIRLWFDRA